MLPTPKFKINEVVRFVDIPKPFYGRVIMARYDKDEWEYLIEESPHRIGKVGCGWLFVANSSLWGQYEEDGKTTKIGPGITMSASWYMEKDLKKKRR